MLRVRIAVFISGNGTNLQALIDSEKNGILETGEIALVISNNEEAYGIRRAEDNGIPCEVIKRGGYDSQAEFEEAIKSALRNYEIDIIVLAGYMSILSPDFIDSYPRRIINIHPSLIPSFCGKGYYGIHVHEAALKYGVKVTGATVHYVNEIPDGGEIILQKAVEIEPEDNALSLQQRVMREAEWIILPQAAEYVCRQYLKSMCKQ